MCDTLTILKKYMHSYDTVRELDDQHKTGRGQPLSKRQYTVDHYSDHRKVICHLHGCSCCPKCIAGEEAAHSVYLTHYRPMIVKIGKSRYVIISNLYFSCRVDIMEADREFRQSVAASDRTHDQWSDNITSTQRLLQIAETEECKWPL
jgi:hypothetical protein